MTSSHNNVSYIVLNSAITRHSTVIKIRNVIHSKLNHVAHTKHVLLFVYLKRHESVEEWFLCEDDDNILSSVNWPTWEVVIIERNHFCGKPNTYLCSAKMGDSPSTRFYCQKVFFQKSAIFSSSFSTWSHFPITAISCRNCLPIARNRSSKNYEDRIRITKVMKVFYKVSHIFWNVL